VLPMGPVSPSPPPQANKLAVAKTVNMQCKAVLTERCDIDIPRLKIINKIDHSPRQ
jgi:hypothetical protein